MILVSAKIDPGRVRILEGVKILVNVNSEKYGYINPRGTLIL